ncbi:MAG: amidase [Candidatus Nephthysia bennettiae]|uniref:Amidase n=1 Tax=Candidatus Nephthysia bennettiae TaxID=3127016 RepID=A0A934KED4_9BACT|nr:amidase [Candidatus Dormibacteraeota bacterium]PZR86057.1 MAG: amidase [Candidatus Dormibacteraeota bacterium]
MPEGDLLGRSALSIGTAIRDKKVSVQEVLDLHLRRVALVNPEINAIVTLAEEEARASAAAADRVVARGGEAGPLHGVPFTVKDVIVTAGVRTTAGSLVLKDFVPTQTAPAVARLQQAGAILIGKTNCPEFALDLHTSNKLFGDTRNPWDLARTPGGSSGGDSAAVASRCAGFGIGTDYGGSIRWPAHCTGLVSIRTTPGIVPGTGQLPFSLASPLSPPNSLSVQGQQQVISPIARTVDDLLVLLRTMAGPDGRDVYTFPFTIADPSAVDIATLRCAWFDGEGTTPVRADIVEAVANAATSLKDAGLTVVNQRPPGFESAEPIFAALRSADGVPDHLRLIGDRYADLTESMRSWIDSCVPFTVAEYRQLASQRDSLRADILSFMAEWPILLMPAASLPAFEVGTSRFNVDGTEIARMDVHVHCRPMSLLRLPVAVVPCGTSREGLPIGVQIVGRPFAEHEVLAVAAALERNFGAWCPKD